MRLRVTAMVMITAALLKLGWQASQAPTRPATPSVAQPLTASRDALPVQSDHSPIPQAEVALNRLRDAFHEFPEKDQPTVVREVNERFAGTEFSCPLAWADGVPSLSVKDKGKAEPMMAAALNQCAAGVERLRNEVDAAAERQSK